MTRDKDALIHTAMRVLTQNPGATLEQIADAAGVTRTTLFRRFRTRQQLISVLSAEAYRLCTEAIDPILDADLCAEEKVCRVVEALLPLGAAFHFLSYEPYHSTDPEIEKLCTSYIARWHRLSALLQSEGLIAPDIPAAWVTALLDLLVFGAWEGIHRGDLAPNTAGALVIRTFFQGVRA